MQKKKVDIDVAQTGKEEEEEEEEKTESDSEETLLEPRFKYSRVLNNVPGVSNAHYSFKEVRI